MKAVPAVLFELSVMSDRQRLILLFSSMAALIVATFTLSHFMGKIVLSATDEVIARHEWSARLSDLLALVREAESSQRGYLLTGREMYLAPYRDAVPKIAATITTLQQNVVSEPAYQPGMTQLIKFIRVKMDELQHTIDLREQQGPEAAAAVVATDAGINAMRLIRQQAKALSDLDESLLAAARIRVTEATYHRRLTSLVAMLIDLAFLSLVFRRINRDRADRLASSLEMTQQKELLAVTLSSIGDAVMVTDVDERITFLNPVAEKLLQRPAAETVGRPCSEVFHIIDEQTRLPLTNPVTYVIEHGDAAGLIKRTLLVRPDGSELPIDDAASPVREPEGGTSRGTPRGTLRGVVLTFRDFTEHREASAKLVAANQQLEAAGKAKDQFMAMLSHELRTPLTPVLGTLVAWDQDAEFPQARRGELKMAKWNVELEARLIDDLLDLTRISTGKLSMNCATIDVHGAVLAVVAMFERELDAKHLHVTIDLKADRHFAVADTARLHQIFWNILKNASKFTPRSGTIAISSECSGDSMHIHFRDTGIGMTPQTLERIFDPLEQGGADITRRYGGLGLGMAISKSLVEAQEGTLVAQSPGVGGGSTFTVSLPAEAAPTQHPDALHEDVAHAFRPLNILLVEDHADTATVIRLILRKAGHQVEIGDSVKVGLEKLRGASFDLLLSDLGLPDGTGIDFIRQVRTTSAIPAIALTGYGMDDDIARCREAGFDRHLTKPVNFPQLIATIDDLMK